MEVPRWREWRNEIEACPQAELQRRVRRLGQEMLDAFGPAWVMNAHEEQLPPEGDDWRIWLMMAGRGFGKTRAGAEWVSALARMNPTLRIALVGATIEEVARVMVRGQSGLIAVAAADEDVIWRPSAGVLTFASGAQAFAYSGANPEGLRGPEHHVAWCDEIAKWARADETWDNLMLGLRLGPRPLVLATTTPRPVALVRRLIVEAKTTRGRTADNRHLPPDFVAAVTARYGGTRLGRQELDGELIEEVEGALWTRALIERCRAGQPLNPLPQARGEALRRVVVGVDPPASAGGDACGIVVCGAAADGMLLVLDDRSVCGLGPDGWARAVVAAAQDWGAERVIAETNQGGEMVAAMLRGVDAALPVRSVKARYGKAQRAEPVAALFEAGKAGFAGAFPELEDELCGLLRGGGYDGPGRSPDRADAMVWAMTELMPGTSGAPRVRGL